MTEYEFHPLADQYPLLDGDDIKAMADDIKANGQRFPILLHEGKILDGRNRYIACKIAGVDPSFDSFPADIDPADFVASANLHRRHLTASQRREAVTRMLKADPTKSNRTVAAETKVDHKTVAAVREDMEACGEIPHTETRTDSGGRKQPAKKPPKPKKPEPWDEETGPKMPDPSPQREPGEDDEEIPAKAGNVLLDGLGLPVPKESLEAFETAAVEFAAVMKLHRQLSEAIDRLANATGGMWVAISCCRTTGEGDKRKYRSDKLHNLAHDIKAARPYTSRCPYCHNEGHARNHKKCEACRGLPYVTKDLWDRAPGDYRDSLLKDMGGQS